MTSEREAEPESVSERLIAALVAEADEVDEGGFSVDLERAGAKLGSFALADPDAWTLLLVEVASLLDATRIDFQYELRSVTVVIEPSTLSKGDLDGLSAWALVDEQGPDDDRRRRARKQLALAYLALRAREVERITIFGVPVDEPAFVLDRTRSSERFGVVEAPFEPGMRFVVELGHWDGDREQRERALLDARCNCSRVPVHIDGFQIAKGWSRIFGNPMLAAPEAIAAQVELPITLDGETIGVAGFHLRKGTDAFVRVLVNGVMVEDVPLDGIAGFRALVEADLRRDLSQGKILRDDRFEAISVAVAEAHAATFDLHAQRGLVLAVPEVEPAVPEAVPAVSEPNEIERPQAPMTRGRVAMLLSATIMVLVVFEAWPWLGLVGAAVIAFMAYLYLRNPSP